jgi:uncharacterized delta-60 repeat protein
MSHFKKFLSLASLLVLVAFPAAARGNAPIGIHAQYSTATSSHLDTTFAPVLASAANVRGIVPLSGGKMLIYGDLNSINGTLRNQVAILNSDGSLDTSFTLDPRLLANGGTVSAVSAVAGGKFLIGGSMTIFGATKSQSYLFRVDASGAIDPTFDAGGWIYEPNGPYGLDGQVTALYVDGSGRILVGGDFTSPESHITRLLADGAADTTFDPGTGTDGLVSHIAMQNNGGIIIAGAFTQVNGSSSQGVARLGTNGAFDGTLFGTGISGSDSCGKTSAVHALAVESDNSVLLGGGFSYINGQVAPVLSRVRTNGSLDTSLGSYINAYMSEVTSLVALGSQVAVGGWRSDCYGDWDYNHRGVIYLLNSTTGNQVGYSSFDRLPDGGETDVWAMAKRSDGKVLAGGSFIKDYFDAENYAGLFLFATSPYYTPDLTFLPIMGNQATVRSLAIQSDKQILAAGDFYYTNGTLHGGLVRLSNAGTVDSTLSPELREWTSVGVRPDGKFVAGQTDAGPLALFEANGSPGATASPGWIYHLLVQPDNKTVTATNHAPGVTRINADMSLDSTFSTNMGSGISNGFNPDGQFDRVDAVALQGTSIIAGGSFSTFSEAAHQNLVRLNANGSLDATFTPPAFTEANSFYRSEVFALAAQPGGKILVGGRFSTLGGVAKPTLARLNANGTLDTTFQSPLADGQVVYALALQPDGKILAGGSFGLVRLNANGSSDASFTSSVNSAVRTLAFVYPDQLLLGGSFTQVDGQPRFGLARYTVPDAYNWKLMFLPRIVK